MHKYGGIVKIANELGLNYLFGNKIDPKELEKDFLRVYNEIGYINSEIYLKYGKYSLEPIKTAFGGLNNLMKKFDIPLNTSRMEDKETVSKDILEICDKYNTTSSNIYRKYGKYAESVIARIFGSWENAMNELNLEFKGKSYGYDYIIESV